MDATPEDLQFLLGIHPDQIAAQQPTDYVTAPPPEEATAQPRPEAAPKEEPQRPRLIATPSARGPRPISVPKPEGEIPPPDISSEGAKPSVGSLMPPATPRPITADQAREQSDQAKLDEMRARGSGVSRFQQRHHIFGPIVRGLDIAGSILAPGVTAQIPGTTQNQRLNESIQEGRVKEDLGIEKEHAAEANREEVDQIRRQAEADRRAQNEAMDKLRDDAEKYKESMRDINYDPQSKQFTRGGQPYTPKDYQEGSMLEVQHGITTFDKNGNILHAGPYTTMWEKEKRNQQPQTHIHYPSAEEEIYQDWRKAFIAENHREPNAQEVNEFRRGGGRGAANQRTFKDSAAIDKYSNDYYAKLRRDVSAEKAKVKSEDPDADDAQLQPQYKRIEKEYADKAAEFERQKKNWYDQLRAGKPVNITEDDQGNPQSEAAPAPAGGPVPGADTAATAGLPAPIAPIRTPTAATAKIGDAQVVGGKTMYVTGFDSKGRPTLGLQKPGAPAAASTPGATPAPTPAGQKYKVGDKVRVGDKELYVVGYNEKTKKPIVSAQPPQQ